MATVLAVSNVRYENTKGGSEFLMSWDIQSEEHSCRVTHTLESGINERRSSTQC